MGCGDENYPRVAYPYGANFAFDEDLTGAGLAPYLIMSDAPERIQTIAGWTNFDISQNLYRSWVPTAGATELSFRLFTCLYMATERGQKSHIQGTGQPVRSRRTRHDHEPETHDPDGRRLLRVSPMPTDMSAILFCGAARKPGATKKGIQPLKETTPTQQAVQIASFPLSAGAGPTECTIEHAVGGTSSFPLVFVLSHGIPP